MPDSIENDNNTIKKMKQLIDLGERLPNTFASTEELNELKKLTTLPDKFNNAFRPMGWIFVEFCCGVDTASKALDMHSDGANEAEIDTLLSNSFIGYDPAANQITNALRLNDDWDDISSALRVFERAYKAHNEEDYLVSVPLFLMVIDKLSLSKTGTKSIFTDVDDFGELFEEKSSFSGHRTALKQVLKVINSSMKGPNEELITIPYRHGILHGTRLNYDNKVVSTKALLLLAAVVEWINDTKPPSKDLAKKQSNNTSFLKKNLVRLNPQSAEEALLCLKTALIQKKSNEIVALLDFDPQFTNFIEKMKPWKEWLNKYDILVEANGGWTVFGETSNREQFAVCEVTLTIDNKTTIHKLQTSRIKEIKALLKKPFWQIDLGFQGTISSEIRDIESK